MVSFSSSDNHTANADRSRDVHDVDQTKKQTGTKYPKSAPSNKYPQNAFMKSSASAQSIDYEDKKESLVFIQPKTVQGSKKSTSSRTSRMVTKPEASSWAIISTNKPWKPSTSSTSSNAVSPSSRILPSARGADPFGNDRYSTPARQGSRLPQLERDAPKKEGPIIDHIAITESSSDGQTERADSTRVSSHPGSSNYRRYNLAKVRFLAGWEKIDLLRQFHAASLPIESMYVYKVLKRNGLMNRIKYLDHHNMFRLLISDPVNFHFEIIFVWNEFKVNGFLRTPNAYAAMVACVAKWGSKILGRKLYQEMKEDNIDIPTETYNHLMKLFSSDVVSLPEPTAEDLSVEHILSDAQTPSPYPSPETESKSAQNPFLGIPVTSPTIDDLNLAAKIWNDMITQFPVKAEPTVTTYTLALQTFASLHDQPAIQKIYNHALESIGRLRHEQQLILGERSSPRSRKSFKGSISSIAATDPGVVIGNAAVAAYMKVRDLKNAEGVVEDMMRPGNALAKEGKMSKKTGAHLLNLLMKLAVFKAVENPHAGLEMAQRVWDDATKRRGVEPDLVSYGRMISIHGYIGDVKGAEDWFERALDRLSVEAGVGSGKLLKLRTSLLQVYAVTSKAVQEGRLAVEGIVLEEISVKVRDLFEKMKEEAELVGKTPLRSSYMFAIDALEAGGGGGNNTRLLQDLKDELLRLRDGEEKEP
jgi:hypothetical protein